MVATCVWTLLFLCSFCMIDATRKRKCVPESTPWSHMCLALRRRDEPTSVKLEDCQQTTLPSSGQYSAGGYPTSVTFWRSNIVYVSRRAFYRYFLPELRLMHTFKKFEPEAFAEMTVHTIQIKQNHELTSLPSGLFRGVNGLVQLYLNANRLKSLPRDLFHGLYTLEGLAVNNNYIACFAFNLFHPLHSLRSLAMGQLVDIEGLCPRIFNGLRPEMLHMGIIDRCVFNCSKGIYYYSVKDNDQPCNCSSYEGCLTCEENPSTEKPFVSIQSPTVSSGSSVGKQKPSTGKPSVTIQSPTVSSRSSVGKQKPSTGKPSVTIQSPTVSSGSSVGKQKPSTGKPSVTIQSPTVSSGSIMIVASLRMSIFSSQMMVMGCHRLTVNYFS